MEIPQNMPVSVTQTAQEWQLVLAGLGKLPLETSYGLFQSIVAQVEGAARNQMPLPKETENGTAKDHLENVVPD